MPDQSKGAKGDAPAPVRLRTDLGPFTLEDEASLSDEDTTNHHLRVCRLVPPRFRCEMELDRHADAEAGVDPVPMPHARRGSLQGHSSTIPPPRTLH